jgi:tRNA(Arg) A34 adenosine deaminase TadA
MDLETFRAAVQDPSTWPALTTDFADAGKRVAYYNDGTSTFYAVTETASVIRPLWLLTMARGKAKALKGVAVATNYAASLNDRSASETGIMQLTLDGMPTISKPDPKSLVAPRGSIYRISLGQRLRDALANQFKVPAGVTMVVDDIQSFTASVKGDSGYTTAGTRTVHRLYLAAAYILLHKKHTTSSKDGVVAIVADKTGNIVSWGMKNPLVSCWHGETSALMRLGGSLSAGGCVFSTLKPCKMCAGLIFDASAGGTKAYYGQEDAGSDAQDTKLDKARLGAALDAHKGNGVPRGLVVATPEKKALGETLKAGFEAQKGTGIKNPIEYITSDAAAGLMAATEQALKQKITKYKATGPSNPNTKRAVEYLVEFLRLQGVSPE